MNIYAYGRYNMDENIISWMKKKFVNMDDVDENLWI
jgi:hypothetical protein